MHVAQMRMTHPEAPRDAAEALQRCIEHCYACAQACSACADACLAEPAVFALRNCIRLNLDCADLCATIGRIATRGTGSNEALMAELLNSCALICRMCADECQRHAGRYEHCRICAAACRACAESCGEAIDALRGD
ncbi:MAG TPA: four-helix bundle copper-binding protein [Allosphingosinicella sp.]|nr:four-helix bundle copper-binding protein [Allosphingosinicella sp.]